MIGSSKSFLALGGACRDLALVALAVASCTGAIEEPFATPGGSPGPGVTGPRDRGPADPTAPGTGSAPPPVNGATPEAPFVCRSTAPPVASPPLRRLTAAQLRNTVRDLAAVALGSVSAADAVIAESAGALDGVPAETRALSHDDERGSFRRLDQKLDQSHVDALYAVGVALGKALGRADRLPALLGSCAGAAGDATGCVEAFLTRVGSRALRRPLAADELAFLKTVYGDVKRIDGAAVADVVTVLVNMPQFYYFVEHGGAAAGAPNSFSLTPYELAARLSYHFWQTMPDDELWRSAETGELSTAAGLRKQVERLFADARTAQAVDEFVIDWLKLEDVPLLDRAHLDDPGFRQLAADVKPTSGLRDAMIDDVVQLFRAHTLTNPRATLDDLLTSEQSFARSAELARIYETPVWDGTGTPPSFPKGARPGLLARAALVSNLGRTGTRPIMKGVLLRKTILCDDLPSPPNDAALTAKFPTGLLSTRQTTEAVTEAVGGSCAGCHKALINPLGFATEGFDALGRRRQMERIFDAAGKELGRVAVDTTTVPQVVLGDLTPVDGAAGLADAVRRSRKPHACFVRNQFRFGFGRFEDPAADGCALARMHQALVEPGGSVAGMLRALALDPTFRTRVFAP